VTALKRDFGKQISFHGGVENQQVLPSGTPEEIRTEVRHSIGALATDGAGYILAPCHNLQTIIRLQNLLVPSQ
jgi:uroporphyrinogen decarboxylase